MLHLNQSKYLIGDMIGDDTNPEVVVFVNNHTVYTVGKNNIGWSIICDRPIIGKIKWEQNLIDKLRNDILAKIANDRACKACDKLNLIPDRDWNICLTSVLFKSEIDYMFYRLENY